MVSWPWVEWSPEGNICSRSGWPLPQELDICRYLLWRRLYSQRHIILFPVWTLENIWDAKPSLFKGTLAVTRFLSNLVVLATLFPWSCQWVNTSPFNCFYPQVRTLLKSWMVWNVSKTFAVWLISLGLGCQFYPARRNPSDPPAGVDQLFWIQNSVLLFCCCLF
jgi:hypothetical protein